MQQHPVQQLPSTGGGCPFKALLTSSSSTLAGSCPWQQQHMQAGQQQLQPAQSTPTHHPQISEECTSSEEGEEDVAALPSSSSSSSSISECSITTTSTSSAASSSSSHPEGVCHQAWKLKRPVLSHDPKLTRRQLRQLNRTWTLADVAQHRYCDDGWIAIDGRVYDITEHIATHPGWSSGCRVTEVLSIIAHLGVDCSTEFHEIHRAYPIAYKQLAAYYIGELEQQ